MLFSEQDSRLTEIAMTKLFQRSLVCLIVTMFAGPVIGVGDEPVSFETLATEYKQDVRPLLEQFCLDCHSSTQKEGELDLQQFATLSHVREASKVWLQVSEMLANGEMPPNDAVQPSLEQRKQLREWLEQYLQAVALAGAGDPGPVVLRRLTNAEYTYTIRDLTDVDLDPTREFPSEGAAGEGFTNTGNALVMSPGLLRKYINAGKEIAAHAILLPAGFAFSAKTTSRDWTDEKLAEIRDFYGRFSRVEKLAEHYGHNMAHLGKAGRIPLEAYFEATLAERDTLTTGNKTIAAVATERRLNAKYLGLLWSMLIADDRSVIFDDLRLRWQNAKSADARPLAQYVAGWQEGLWTFNPVGLLGRKGYRSRWMEAVSPLQPDHKMTLLLPAAAEGEEPQDFVVSLIAGDAGDDSEHDYVVWTQPRLTAEGKPDEGLPDWITVAGAAVNAASVTVRAPSVIKIRIPAKYAGYQFATTASLDPNLGDKGSVQVDIVSGSVDLPSSLLASEYHVTYADVDIGADKRSVSWRRPILVADSSDTQEQFEAAFDEFRDLFPAAICYTQIVPVDEILTLTLLYREDDHLTRLMLNDEQTRHLDRLWEQLRFVSREPLRLVEVLDSLVETTNDHPQAGIFDDAVESFNVRAATFRGKLVASETTHLDALVAFASRAWRRPLLKIEKHELQELYQSLRELNMSHDEAFRLTLARVFVASSFLYRLEEAPNGTDAAPVSNTELASRLSYFLWSSAPDQKLAATSANGTLGESTELIQQTQRMLRDTRVRRLATEFGCQWLHVHEFDPLEQKSKTLFPEFPGLRADMYEETIVFFTDLFQHDRSLLNLLNADHTFVNERLARFYGVSGVTGDSWQRVDGIQQHGRGGILGMATTLARQSGAARTSPILRGNWISEVLLGEKLPRPPKDVPQLADTVPAGLTERQLIERHSSDAACAKCHARIDPFGFALEGFDAIGGRRWKNSDGLMINSQTTLPDGSTIEGLSGLRDYLLETRRDEFLRQFCRKLVGYALGRELQLSDRLLIDEMLARLEENSYRFSTAVETIVLSDQFRKIRAGSSGR